MVRPRSLMIRFKRVFDGTECRDFIFIRNPASRVFCARAGHSRLGGSTCCRYKDLAGREFCRKGMKGSTMLCSLGHVIGSSGLSGSLRGYVFVVSESFSSAFDGRALPGYGGARCALCRAGNRSMRGCLFRRGGVKRILHCVGFRYGIGSFLSGFGSFAGRVDACCTIGSRVAERDRGGTFCGRECSLRRVLDFGFSGRSF